jgi:hypothetical protein
MRDQQLSDHELDALNLAVLHAWIRRTRADTPADQLPEYDVEQAFLQLLAERRGGGPDA